MVSHINFNSRVVSNHLGRASALVLLAVLGVFSGCGIADAPQPEQKIASVKQYYTNLESTTAQYVYSILKYGNADTLQMSMHGDAPNKNYKSVQLYSCSWHLLHAGVTLNWYYAMNDSVAYDMGSGYNVHMESEDLVAPAVKGTTWKFYDFDRADSVTATITAIANAAAIGGKSYSDVIQVNYTSSALNSTKLFAAGVGLIYSASTDNMGEQIWQLTSHTN